MKTKFRSGYDHGPRVAKEMPGESRTEQSHKASCDINHIMSRYRRTGVLEHLNTHGPRYGYASSEGFQEAMDIVAEGQSMFADLPSHIRNKFGNDPARFLEFVQNPKNGDEMVELGLAVNRPVKAPEKPFELEQEQDGPKDPPKEKKSATKAD